MAYTFCMKTLLALLLPVIGLVSVLASVGQGSLLQAALLLASGIFWCWRLVWRRT